jgi:hypothetical protein
VQYADRNPSVLIHVFIRVIQCLDPFDGDLYMTSGARGFSVSIVQETMNAASLESLGLCRREVTTWRVSVSDL